jgi:hypothetical protein
MELHIEQEYTIKSSPCLREMSSEMKQWIVWNLCGHKAYEWYKNSGQDLNSGAEEHPQWLTVWLTSASGLQIYLLCSTHMT